MSRIIGKWLATAVTVAVLTTCSGVVADDAAIVATARELLKKHQGAIVYVSAKNKVTERGFGIDLGTSDPDRRQVAGIVLDETGLIVTAIGDLFANSAITIIVGGEGEGEMQRSSEVKITDVNICLADGSEIPAKVVLKDPDVGLAFLRATDSKDAKKLGELASLGVEAAPAPELLAPVVVLGRRGEKDDYAPTLSLARVECILTKPQTRYCAPVATGLPAFDSQGRVLGIGVLPVADETPTGLGALLSGGRGSTATVLPFGEVLRSASRIPK